MDLKEKIKRIEEVVKMNNVYVRQIYKSLKMVGRTIEVNVDVMKKITEALVSLNIMDENGDNHIIPMSDDIMRLYK